MLKWVFFFFFFEVILKCARTVTFILLIHSTDVEDSLIPLKKEETWETLKWATNIKDHDFGNLLLEEGHELPTIFHHRSCYQYFTMKSGLQRINAGNTKRLELLETKLWAFDSHDTYKSTCRPNQGLVGKGNNPVLKK